MIKRKLPTDAAQRAKFIVDLATGQAPPEIDPNEGKNPAAVALGKLGGVARYKSLSPENRTKIAKKAAKKRWRK